MKNWVKEPVSYRKSYCKIARGLRYIKGLRLVTWSHGLQYVYSYCSLYGIVWRNMVTVASLFFITHPVTVTLRRETHPYLFALAPID